MEYSASIAVIIRIPFIHTMYDPDFLCMFPHPALSILLVDFILTTWPSDATVQVCLTDPDLPPSPKCPSATNITKDRNLDRR